MAVPPPPSPTRHAVPGDSAKPALRARLRAARTAHAKARGADGRRADALAATARLLPHLPADAVVAAYLAFHNEFDATPLIDALAARGVPLALPALLDAVTMVFRAWAPGDALERGPFRLRQPPASAPERTPTVVVAPLLGFDRAGGRIGQGASHFDRAFARYPGARRLGLAWAMQEVERLPRDPWDADLDAVVTEAAFLPMPRRRP